LGCPRISTGPKIHPTQPKEKGSSGREKEENNQEQEKKVPQRGENSE